MYSFRIHNRHKHVPVPKPVQVPVPKPVQVPVPKPVQVPVPIQVPVPKPGGITHLFRNKKN